MTDADPFRARRAPRRRRRAFSEQDARERQRPHRILRRPSPLHWTPSPQRMWAKGPCQPDAIDLKLRPNTVRTNRSNPVTGRR